MKPTAGKASLSTLFFVTLVNLIGFGLIIPLLPHWSKSLGMTDLSIGLLFASYSVGQVIAAPILGRLSDRVGRRPILLLSIVGTAVSFIMLGVGYQLRSIWMLFVSRTLDGITGGNISVAQAYAADITTHKQRSHAMGLLGAAFGLGFVLGPAFGAGLSLKFWQPVAGSLFEGLPAYGAAVLAVASLVMAWWMLPETIDRSAAHHAEVVGPDLLHVRRLLSALANPILGGILAIYFVAMLAWAGMEVFFVALIGDRINFLSYPDPHHAQTIATFLFFVLIGIVMVLVQGGLVGRMARRFGEPVLIAAGSVVVAVSFLVLAEGYGVWMLILGSVAMSVGQGLFSPSATGLISVFSGADEQGQNLGLGQSVGAIARIGGPVLFGWLYGISSRHAGMTPGRLPFLTGTVLIALSAAAAFFLLPGLRRGLAARHAAEEPTFVEKF
ncbi:MAG: Tetracycline resistance protein, class B [Phycisphaerae bacterium]|nr:Tetracycline resistance protein, class B [Phycisphaerae bacterium]